MQRIVFDENVPHAIVEAVISLAPYFSPTQRFKITSVHILGKDSSPDATVLGLVGKDGILVTYDKDFKTIQALSKTIKDKKIGVFLIRQVKKPNIADLAKNLIKHLDKLLSMGSEEIKPFLIELTKNGLERREL